MDYTTKIQTTVEEHSVVVDRFDDNEVWLSIRVHGGGAHCVLNREQALEMIDAIQRALSVEV